MLSKFSPLFLCSLYAQLNCLGLLIQMKADVCNHGIINALLPLCVRQTWPFKVVFCGHKIASATPNVKTKREINCHPFTVYEPTQNDWSRTWMQIFTAVMCIDWSHESLIEDRIWFVQMFRPFNIRQWNIFVSSPCLCVPAHPDRSVLWRGGSRADDKPGQHLPVLLQQDLWLPVCVRPGERQQGCSRTSLRLCGEMFITQAVPLKQ